MADEAAATPTAAPAPIAAPAAPLVAPAAPPSVSEASDAAQDRLAAALAGLRAAPEAAPAVPPTPAPDGTTPAPPPTPGVEAAPVATPTETPAALPVFATAEQIAAAERIGLSAAEAQSIFRSVPESQREALLKSWGIGPSTPAGDPLPAEPPPIDYSALSTQLDTYLAQRDPDAQRLIADYRETTTSLGALQTAAAEARTRLADAEAAFRFHSRPEADPLERAEAETARSRADLEVERLQTKIWNAEQRVDRLSSTFDARKAAYIRNYEAQHAAQVQAAREAAAAAAENRAYAQQFTQQFETSLDSAFASLGLDAGLKGAPNAAPNAPRTLNFRDFVKSEMLAATIHEPIPDISAFIASRAPAFKQLVEETHRAWSRHYATQALRTPGPAATINPVASPEAVSPAQFDGDIDALSERKAEELRRFLQGNRPN